MLISPGDVEVELRGGPHPPPSGLVGDVYQVVVIALDVACETYRDDIRTEQMHLTR